MSVNEQNERGGERERDREEELERERERVLQQRYEKNEFDTFP